MLSTNIFYSGYNILFSILSLFIGFGSVFLIREAKTFRSMLQFQLGALCLVLITYLTVNEHILYKFGLNFNFVIFIQSLLALLTSVLWINASAELYAGRPANRESLTLFITLCLSAGLYYSFVRYNQNSAVSFNAVITIIGLSLLLFTTLIITFQSPNSGHIMLSAALFMLWGKLIVSSYFFKYGWLNLNLFNWLWIYVFTAAVIFMKFTHLKNELQKSWVALDKMALQMNNMIDSSPFPIIIAKLTDGKLLLINNKASVLLGITKKETGYHKLKDFFVDEENRNQFFTQMEKEHEVQDFDLMVCNVINTSPFWLSVSAKTIEFNNEMALYMAFQNITLRKERENALQNQADKDPLTQTWNRRYFEKLLPEKIKQSITNAQYYSLLMLDADKFKNINDTYGHKTGDKVLIQLAKICLSSLREDDIVCRFGGEEFVIYLNNTNTTAALSVAERLRANIAAAYVEDDEGNTITFTVSIGVVSSEKTDSQEVLLRQVDDAMYLAKNNGRNRVEVYNEQEVKKIMSKKTPATKRNIHPVFQNEEAEEISLLDNYENKIL